MALSGMVPPFVYRVNMLNFGSFPNTSQKWVVVCVESVQRCEVETRYRVPRCLRGKLLHMRVYLASDLNFLICYV